MKFSKTQVKARKQTMISALVASMGIVTSACKISGISRRAHYDWMRDDEAYFAAVDDIQDIALDFAETALHQQIRDGITSSTIFYLKTKGRKRGYIEKVEQHHINKNETTVQIADGGIPEWLEVPDNAQLEQKNEEES